MNLQKCRTGNSVPDFFFPGNYLASHLADDLCRAANLQVDSRLNHLEHQPSFTKYGAQISNFTEGTGGCGDYSDISAPAVGV